MHGMSGRGSGRPGYCLSSNWIAARSHRLFPKALLAGGLPLRNHVPSDAAAIDKTVREQIPEMLVGAGTVLNSNMWKRLIER